MATQATKAESAPPLKATTTSSSSRSRARRASRSARHHSRRRLHQDRRPRPDDDAAGRGAHASGTIWARTVVDRCHHPGQERPELGEPGRSLVEPHGVDAVLQVVGVHTEQGDPPLPVVDPGRAGDDLERCARRTCGRRRRGRTSSPCAPRTAGRTSWSPRRRRDAWTSGRSRRPSSPPAAAAGRGASASSRRGHPAAYSDTSVSDT